ncbi:RDD family protein [Flaviaesturariibacter aridisoli]|uniref:RDD family protein n=2 Tax=Flaviaesturariibacter aridisoli TaxID=2545761 RepID=A0A4R4E6J7_9BACT|nr:RDD family protein [Flaviaesturariibacter aridisoli]
MNNPSRNGGLCLGSVKYRNFPSIYVTCSRTMSTIHIPTSFNISITFPAAPFHRRLLAWIIDFAILATYAWGLKQIFDAAGEVDEEASQALRMFFQAVPIFLYHPVCELLMNGQSPGKRLMQLRVISDKGGRPSVSQVVIRWLIRTSDVMIIMCVLFLPYAALNPEAAKQIAVAFGLFVLDVVLVNVTGRHQRLGDILAHTILIRSAQKAGIEETIFLNVKDNYSPQYPQVLHLSDRDINAIKNILDSARKHHDYGLAERASEKIKRHLNIQNSMSPFEFLEILLKDYNYLTTH